MTEELLRLKNTARVLDISRSTLLRRMKDDKDFPEPIKIGRFLYWKSTANRRKWLINLMLSTLQQILSPSPQQNPPTTAYIRSVALGT